MIRSKSKNTFVQCGEGCIEKSNHRVGKRYDKPRDSCMHVLLGDSLSVCQNRYFCQFSAALQAARDTPRVIAGCLLSLAKKEKAVKCMRARVCM